MATIFPLSASVGQQFQDYAFDGESWNIIGENWKPFIYSATEPDFHEAGFIWVDSNEVVDEIYVLPPQAGNAGKFLTTSGSVSSWGTVDLTPYLTQSSASTTYLTQTSASTTYLTQTSGSSTYATKSGPAFTGTANFLSASANFTSASVVGILDVAEVRETVVSNSFSTNVMTANYNDGAIHYATVAPTGNFTISLTNVPTTTSKSITMSFLITQGSTGYIPTTLNLNGSSQTIRWVGGSAPTPTSSAGKIDIFNFTLILAASNVVIASSNLNI